MGTLRITSPTARKGSYADMNVHYPEIIEACWTLDIAKYGQETQLIVKAKDASEYKIVVKIRSDHWNTNYYDVKILDAGEPDADGIAEVQYKFTPDVSFLNDDGKEMNKVEMFADIWLVRPYAGAILNKEAVMQFYCDANPLFRGSKDPLSRIKLKMVEACSVPVGCTVKKIVIAIDPGHGDHHDTNSMIDPGAVNGIDKEKDWALLIAQELSNILIAQSQNTIAVIMTREGDVENAGERLRWRVAAAEGSEIFVSIHLNSVESAIPTAFGYEVLYKLGHTESQNLASDIFAANTLLHKRRIVASNKDVVLREFKSGPSVLVEPGFLSNTDDLKIIKEKFCAIAQEIANGIFNYLKR